MFLNAKNVHIGGQASFVQYNENVYNVDPKAESVKEGIQLLVSRVVAGAMHNSGDRFDAPTCHPETRTAIQDDVLGWSDELVDDLNELVTWLYGPAGAGKSAIAQTIALKLLARGQLTASFFFSRTSSGKGRGTETNFVATLAHQLSQSLPATKPHIGMAVRENPLIFDMALQDQVDALIVAPLVAISDESSSAQRPRIIVIDGLDECRKEDNAQRRVVNALISGLCQIPHHNHKLFITSRSEYNIVEIFKAYEEKLVRRMELDSRWNPNEDIRTLLNAGFADIRRSHFYFRSHFVEKTWPNPDIIGTLVHRASGQFIYASVVLKYIKSEENYNPVTRLETILQLNNNGDRPYAELDALYEYIFSQIRGVEPVRVVTFLSLERMRNKFPCGPLDLNFDTLLSNTVLGVHMDEIKFWLLPLASILGWRSGKIRYIHASLSDFLLDPTRSKTLCINAPAIATGIIRRAIELFEDGTALMDPFSIPFLIGVPTYYADVLPRDQKLHVYSLLSSFNIVETVLRKINTDHLNAYAVSTALALATYLDWVLTESESQTASCYLHKNAVHIHAIHGWLVDQFECPPDFNHLDNIGKMDLWPFFLLKQWKPTRELAQYFSAALTICRSSTSHHELQTNFNSSHQIAILCHYLMSWRQSQSFHQLDLFVSCAMIKERYGMALGRTAYYLLQLPTTTLERILRDRVSDEDPIMRLVVSEVLPAFLVRSPPTTDLYFLVVLTGPMVGCPGRQFFRGDAIRRHISTYLQQAIEQYPFLQDPTSPEYIQAKAKFEKAWINLKIRKSLSTLAEVIWEDLEAVEPLIARVDLEAHGSVSWRGLVQAFAAIGLVPRPCPGTSHTITIRS